MSAPYRTVTFSTRKILFDLTSISAMFLYLVLFVVISLSRIARPDYVEIATVLVRAYGTLAIILLHFVLAIGPLCRLNPAFLPILENRRHLGVMTFFVALVHGVGATALYHAGGEMNPLASILVGNGQIFSPAEWSFAILGLVALVLLAILAVTSHDFWIAYFTPERWKRLHMLVYAAYGLVVFHVALGALQEVSNPIYILSLSFGMTALIALHWKAAQKERVLDTVVPQLDREGWVRVCAPAEIPEGRARILCVGAERVAVFRHWQGISAISNVCAHQGGPLGEGEMTAGCVRCPWHGSLYFPQTGMAPPPGTHQVHTYRTKLVDGIVFLNPNPNPLGTMMEPTPLPDRKGKAGTGGVSLQFDRGMVSPQRKEGR